MRTSGTFQDVYEAARQYEMAGRDDCPMDPVVRREEGKWMLESGLNSTEGDFEVTLEAFDSWFYESYKDADYTPSESDIEEFVGSHQE